MLPLHTVEITQAMEDFRRARRQAALQAIMARLTGESIDLLSYEDVRQKFRLGTGSSRGLQEVPLEAIVGSVNRYTDFTRNFLPRLENDEARWAAVKTATLDSTGVPPIELYKIGQVYFVVDGNHRVSVARQLGTPTIQAYVTEFKTKVPLEPDDQPDDILIKAEYANFLEKTRLDELRPESDLIVTVPGRYWELETQIEAHRYLMSQEQERQVPYQEAVLHWHDHVYRPTVEIIRAQGILADFPDRTETDLFLWLIRHQVELRHQLGWEIDAQAAAADLAAQHSPTANRVAARVEGKLKDALAPDSLEGGPTAGQWRQELGVSPDGDRLFSNLLAPLTGTPQSWAALDQALVVARREQSRIYGLHVVSDKSQVDEAAIEAVQTEFERRCAEANIPGQFSVEEGGIARTICNRARWAHLVVIHLAHPPGLQPAEKLSSGFRTVLHRCPRPVLTARQTVQPLARALVAYDGSPKAQEGLLVATYLAGRWQIPVMVTTIIKQPADEEILAQARAHLESRGVQAAYLPTAGPTAETILGLAAEHNCDLLIMGGYGSSPMLEVVLGSTVDQVLREFPGSMLICR